MTIQEKIKADLKQAMLSKDHATRDMLRVVLGEFTRIGREVPDEKALGILKKMRENAIEVDNSGEVEILNRYLPEELSEEAAKEAIETLIKEEGYSSMKDMGSAMQAIKQQFGASIDGKLASTVVRSMLS